MAKKNRGFNTPFEALKNKVVTPPKPAAPPPSKKARTEIPATDVDDDSLFEAAMFGVKKRAEHGHAAPTPRLEPKKRHRSKTLSDDEQVVEHLQQLVDGQASFNVTVEDMGELVEGRAPGVNGTLLRKLRRGDIPYRRHIDLHGYTREEAHELLKSFIIKARRDDQRCVLVVTGRGKSSPGGVGVLREVLPRWLGRAPIGAHVLAFSTARRTDGGPGAFYVLLRRAGSHPYA